MRHNSTFSYHAVNCLKSWLIDAWKEYPLKIDADCLEFICVPHTKVAEAILGKMKGHTSCRTIQSQQRCER